MNKINLLLAACLPALGLLSAAPAAAQPPSEESVARLMAVQNMEASVRQMLPAASAVMEEEFRQDLQRHGYSEAQQNAWRKTVFPLLERVMQRAAGSLELHREMEAVIRQAVREIYTQEEVDALVAFYASPVGQSVRSKQGQFSALTMTRTSLLVDRYIKAEMNRIRPQIERAWRQVDPDFRAE